LVKAPLGITSSSCGHKTKQASLAALSACLPALVCACCLRLPLKVDFLGSHWQYQQGQARQAECAINQSIINIMSMPSKIEKNNIA
jgi:hypothetical protein